MIEGRFIDVGGIRTHYFEAGSGPEVVLIHGGHFGTTYSAYHWSLNFDGLSSDYHLYAVDKLGQGRTDNPSTADQYTMTATIEHVYQFIVAAGIERPVLVGHSRGALPAMRIAVDHPDLVRGVVIVDTNTLAAEHPSTPVDFYRRLEQDVPAVIDEEFVRREPEANSFSRDHITSDFVAEMVALGQLPKNRAARELMDAVTTQFVHDVLRCKYKTLDMIRHRLLKVPTLIVWGLHDVSAPVVLAQELFNHVALRAPMAQLQILSHAGHYVFRERPREFNRSVRNFVDDLA